MKIAIDIGHAERTGSVTKLADEHKVAAAHALVLKKLLETHAQGNFEVDVLDFPTLSNSKDLTATVRAVNAGGYDVLVSLHCDCSENEDACGAHVCYHAGSKKGRELAKQIAGRLCPVMPGRATWVQPRPDSKKGLSGLKILRETVPPAVLVECGFISNEEDVRTMVSRRFKCMHAVAAGILAFCDAGKEVM